MYPPVYTSDFPFLSRKVMRSVILGSMKDLITFLDNNGKYAVYTGGEIHEIYRYLEMNGAPTTLTTSGQ